MDLFNNPMVNSAKNALTPEQQEQYRLIGDYMYNQEIYKTIENKKEPTDIDYLTSAVEALKAGLHPNDLKQQELVLLVNTYGENWYEKFGYEKDDISVSVKLSRQQRRALERKQRKNN